MEKHDHELNLMNDNTKLLHDIRGLLKEVLFYLKPEEKNIETEINQYPCKACGGVHENKGQLLACAKKYKKEALNNVDRPKIQKD